MRRRRFTMNWSARRGARSRKRQNRRWSNLLLSQRRFIMNRLKQSLLSQPLQRRRVSARRKRDDTQQFLVAQPPSAVFLVRKQRSQPRAAVLQDHHGPSRQALWTQKDAQPARSPGAAQGGNPADQAARSPLQTHR